MLQTRVYGQDRIAFMESITVADVHGFEDNSGSLTLFTNDQGGIIDDLIVSKTNLGYLYVVSNAGCRDKDIPLMKNAEEHFKNEGLDVHLDFMEDHALIAVQGPEMAAILESVSKLDMSSLPFMTSIVSTIGG